MARIQPVLTPTGLALVDQMAELTETAEFAVLEGKGNRLSAEELGSLAKRLATASDPHEAARLKERLTRGFYGI
jgi:hypothetical protein